MEVVLGEEESLRWEGFVKRIGFMPGVKEWELNGGLSQLHSADNEAIAWLTNYGSWCIRKKCFDTAGWVTKWHRACKKSVPNVLLWNNWRKITQAHLKTGRNGGGGECSSNSACGGGGGGGSHSTLKLQAIYMNHHLDCKSTAKYYRQCTVAKHTPWKISTTFPAILMTD